MAAKEPSPPPSAMVEYKSLSSISDKLISMIASDPLPLANVLFARGLISKAKLSSASQGKYEQATEIVQQVLNTVEHFPQKFEVFLNAVKEQTWLENLAESIEETYEKFKEEAEEDIDSTPDVESDEDQGERQQDQPQSPSERFSYLKTEGLTQGERERLIGRLTMQSDKMMKKFALVVDGARKSLEKQKLTSKDLQVLIRHGTKNKLYDVFKKKRTIHKLFLKMADYWSFFDYEFLSLIIDGFCTELQADMARYELDFKEYCQHRLCEIPADVFQTRPNEKNNLYVKCDHYFDKITLKEAKALELRLSELLDAELYLLRVKEGCVQLVFGSLCDLNTKFPLNHLQKKGLYEMKILHLFHEDRLQYDREIFAFESNKIPDSELSLIAREVQQANKVQELAGELEMPGHFQEDESSVMSLLLQWQERIVSMKMSSRPVLMYHFARIGLQDLHLRLFSTYQENCETKDLEIQSLKQKLEEFRTQTENDLSTIKICEEDLRRKDHEPGRLGREIKELRLSQAQAIREKHLEILDRDDQIRVKDQEINRLKKRLQRATVERAGTTSPLQIERVAEIEPRSQFVTISEEILGVKKKEKTRRSGSKSDSEPIATTAMSRPYGYQSLGEHSLHHELFEEFEEFLERFLERERELEEFLRRHLEEASARELELKEAREERRRVVEEFAREEFDVELAHARLEERERRARARLEERERRARARLEERLEERERRARARLEERRLERHRRPEMTPWTTSDKIKKKAESAIASLDLEVHEQKSDS